MSVHIVRVWREKKWPRQWIGMCSCGKGIRCNSEKDARDFLRGCLEALATGLPSHPVSPGNKPETRCYDGKETHA